MQKKKRTKKKPELTESDEATPKSLAKLFVIMKAYKFESLEAMGLALNPPPDGPHRFIPVFNTLEQARKFEPGAEVTVIYTGASCGT